MYFKLRSGPVLDYGSPLRSKKRQCSWSFYSVLIKPTCIMGCETIDARDPWPPLILATLFSPSLSIPRGIAFFLLTFVSLNPKLNPASFLNDVIVVVIMLALMLIGFLAALKISQSLR